MGLVDRSGTRNQPKKWGFKASWRGLFFIFVKFLAYLMIFQSFAVLHFERSSNMPNIWQKNDLPKINFSMALPTPKSQVSGHTRSVTARWDRNWLSFGWSLICQLPNQFSEPRDNYLRSSHFLLHVV